MIGIDLLQAVYSQVISPDETVAITDVEGVKVVFTFKSIDISVPVSVSGISITACGELSK